MRNVRVEQPQPGSTNITIQTIKVDRYVLPKPVIAGRLPPTKSAASINPSDVIHFGELFHYQDLIAITSQEGVSADRREVQWGKIIQSHDHN